MTRFQIVGIFNDSIWSAGEFNGDGYWSGRGKEVCEAFQKQTTKQEYEKFVNKINKSYRVEEEYLISINIPEDDLDFYYLEQHSDYYNKWFSDYLYIKNYSSEDHTIIDNKGINIVLHPQGYCVLYYGELKINDEEREGYDPPMIYKADVDYMSHLQTICEDHGWNWHEGDDYIELSQYTPNGEDFSFTVDKDNVLYSLRCYVKDFDPDEHAVEMIKNYFTNYTPSVRALINDAEWLQEELEELLDALEGDDD